jgi:hypothetical protein
MKQAIQEGFILDVLKNYTPVTSYYKLVKTVEADPEFDTKPAKKKLRRYVESQARTACGAAVTPERRPQPAKCSTCLSQPLSSSPSIAPMIAGAPAAGRAAGPRAHAPRFYFMTSQTMVQARVATTTLPRTTSGRTHLRSRCGEKIGSGNNDVLEATKPSANVESNRSIIIACLPLHNVTLAGRPSELREIVHRYLGGRARRHPLMTVHW